MSSQPDEACPKTLEDLPPWTEDQWMRLATMLAHGLEENERERRRAHDENPKA